MQEQRLVLMLRCWARKGHVLPSDQSLSPYSRGKIKSSRRRKERKQHGKNGDGLSVYLLKGASSEATDYLKLSSLVCDIEGDGN